MEGVINKPNTSVTILLAQSFVAELVRVFQSVAFCVDFSAHATVNHLSTTLRFEQSQYGKVFWFLLLYKLCFIVAVSEMVN